MIIGITGRLHSGKDTFADYLLAALLDAELAVTVRTSFAKKLRDVAEAAFGCRYETQEEKERLDEFWNSRIRVHRTDAEKAAGPLLGDEDVTGRRILQYAGTELFRERGHTNFWVFCLARAWETSKASGKRHLIITDCRFDNEARWVRDNGGMVIETRRPGISDVPVKHASERGVSPDLVSKSYTCQDLIGLRCAAATVSTHLRTPRNHSITGSVSLLGSLLQGRDKRVTHDDVCTDIDEATSQDLPQG